MINISIFINASKSDSTRHGFHNHFSAKLSYGFYFPETTIEKFKTRCRKKFYYNYQLEQFNAFHSMGNFNQFLCNCIPPGNFWETAKGMAIILFDILKEDLPNVEVTCLGCGEIFENIKPCLECLMCEPKGVDSEVNGVESEVKNLLSDLTGPIV